MCQLLFVDDEPVLLKSMVANDWAGIGIDGVFGAASGLEALELLASVPIDIVVTDIRMPGMDGLRLCKHIQEHYPKIKCILLSGYGEFEYARQAIVYGISNYLLKPVKDEELMDEVARTKAQLEQERERLVHGELAHRSLRVHMPMLRANLLGDLLAGLRLPNAVLAERTKEYGLSFEPGSTCEMLLIRPDESESAIRDALLYEFAVHNIVNELLEPRFEVWQTKDAYGYLCYALKEKRGEPAGGGEGDRPEDAAPTNDVLKEVAREAAAKVAVFLRGSISAMIGPWGSFPSGLVDQYRQSLNAFRKVPRSERGIVAGWNEPRLQSRSLESLYAPPSFQQLLEAERWPDARRKLSAMFEEMQAKKQDTEEHLTEVVYALMNAFLYKAHSLGKTLMELTGFEADIATEPGLLGRLDQVAEWTEMTLRRMESSSAREGRDHKNQIIPKIHRYIESQIAGDVSLQAIADHVGLHPAYLSSLYKQETEENISDYIMRFRMEKAGSLLRTTDIKIYELSGRLGFQNPPYFSKLFKYYYGVTPQEYRLRNQS